MKYIRSGLITKKLGIIQIFKNNGEVELVTLILVPNNIVLNSDFSNHSFKFLVISFVAIDKLKQNMSVYWIYEDVIVECLTCLVIFADVPRRP